METPPLTLHVQKYLSAGNTLDQLSEQYGIITFHHPTLPLVGLKYSQINSPKLHPITRECRGLVLNRTTWELVGKGFDRFFNVGEDAENYAQFEWDGSTAQEKHDGSFILVYFSGGEWHVNTKGSFGLGECGHSGRSWREVFIETLGVPLKRFAPLSTYCFELCTPFNKVVRSYEKPIAYLLSAFDTYHEDGPREWKHNFCDIFAEQHGLNRPALHRFKSIDEVKAALAEKEQTDKTFEGFVLRDRHNRRFKAKSQTYLALHHLKDNGNIFNPKNLVPLVLNGEIDEVSAYMPEVAEAAKAASDVLQDAYASLWQVAREAYGIVNQKDFALSIKGRTPFSSILFQVRKDHGCNYEERHVRDQWMKSADMIVKALYP